MANICEMPIVRLIGHLVAAVRDGELVIHRVREGLVWSPPATIGLIDSLWRGFPVGTIYVCRVFDEAISPMIDFGTTWINPGLIKPGSRLVVDGRQRIASLVQAFSHGSGYYLNLGDLEKADIRHMPGTVSDDPNLLPLVCALDENNLIAWQRRCIEVGVERRVVTDGRRAFNMMRNNTLHVSMLHCKDMAEAQLVASRLNHHDLPLIDPTDEAKV